MGSIVLKNNYCVQGASIFSALHNRVKVVLSTTTLKAAGTGDMGPEEGEDDTGQGTCCGLGV